MTKARIVVVEDKFIVAEDLSNTLSRLGYEVVGTAVSASEAIDLVGTTQPDIVLMDIRLKGAMDGIEAAQILKSRFGSSVIYITAHSDDVTLQRASATNPLGYLLKPFEERQLYTTLELALSRKSVGHGSGMEPASAARSISSFSRQTQDSVRFNPEFRLIVGHHPLLLELLERVELVAKTDVTVHIYGENGTGKELVADAVHHLSARRDKPFVKLNCSAIPATLLESALFGHVKGSFTGATRDQQGFVEHAAGGTLFLDEIGDLAQDIQLKLLRLLQTREFCKIGDPSTRMADIRVITATNRNLRALVKEGKIRDDFFYRIHVFPLIVPALRDRSSDIPELAEHFREIFNQTFHKRTSGFTAGAISALQRHCWAGNIRELENAVRHAFVVVPDNDRIGIEHLPPDVLDEHSEQPSIHERVERSAAPSGTHADREREAILNALDQAGGSKIQAAKLLGYSRVTLWKKMTRLGLMEGRPAPAAVSGAEGHSV